MLDSENNKLGKLFLQTIKCILTFKSHFHCSDFVPKRSWFTRRCACYRAFFKQINLT